MPITCLIGWGALKLNVNYVNHWMEISIALIYVSQLNCRKLLVSNPPCLTFVLKVIKVCMHAKFI